MRELLVVLNTRAQSFLKRAFELRWQTIVQNVASFLIFGGFAVAVFFVSRSATEYLIKEAHIGMFLFHRFLSMLLYVFFITVNLGNMIVSFSTLYKSQEVHFLMSLPISHAKIFLIKFVDNFFYSSSTLTLLGLAMLLGYGSFFEMPWYFYFFVMFFVLLPFMLIAGILAITSLMLLIKLGTRIGFRLLLVMIIAAYAACVYAYFTFTNPMALVDDVMKLWPDVNDYLGYLDPPFVKFLPNHWVAEFLYWSISGDWGRAMPYFSLLFLTMLGLVALAGLMARRFYYESWLAVSDLQAGGNTARNTRSAIFSRSVRVLPPQWDVLLRRDVAAFIREPSQWLHLMLMFLLLAMFLFSLGTLKLAFDQPAVQTVAFLVVFMFNGFLIASIALRFVFPLISLEGDAFWCVRTSPVSLKKLYWYKLLAATAAVIFIAETLALASVFLFDAEMALAPMTAAAMFCIAAALVALNVGAGGYFAIYRERNPIRIASSQGASLTFLASMVYLTLVVSVMVVPLNRYFHALDFPGFSTMDWIYLPLGVIGVLSLIVITISTGVGMSALKRSA